MKKIILIILLLCPILKVNAENYQKFQSVEELSTALTEVEDIKEESKYLWYNIKREGLFFPLGENQPDYSIFTNIVKYQDWGEWSKEKPEEKINREIESRNIYFYQKRKPITKIEISRMEPQNLQVENIHIYKGIYEISFVKKEKDSRIILELEEPCMLEELEVIFTLIDVSTEEKHFEISWLYDLNTIGMQTYSRFWFQGAYETTYQYRNMNSVTELWGEVQSSFEKLENTFTRIVSIEMEYRYRDLLYFYEKESRDYYETYESIAPIGYPYPDLSTKKSLIQIKKKENMETNSLVSELPNGVFCSIVKKEEKCDELEKKLEEANATIMSFQNEESREKEVLSKKDITRNQQSTNVGTFILLFLFFIGLMISRILAMKKKF